MWYNKSLSRRIYLIMLAYLLVVALVIVAAAAWYFNKQNENYHKDRILRKQQSVLRSIDYYFLSERESEFFPFYTSDFEKKLNEFADVNQVEVIVYDLGGDLLTASNLNFVYQRSLEKIPLEAVEQLNQALRPVVIDQIIDGKDLLLSYEILTNDLNEPIGYVCSSYAFDLATVRAELYAFLWRMVLALALVLPIGVGLAFLLSNYIIRSIKALQNEINHLDINKINDTLNWPHDDEIGTLIKAYNNKVRELEQSAALIAQNEREFAWREMAKQVAHEIKNPLTPMKLSLQHLARSAKDNPEVLQERFEHFSKTMIAQINTLSEIASSFSDFAKMPQAKPIVVSIIAEAKKAVELFENAGEYDLIFEMPEAEDDLLVFIDPQHLQRVFNNLIKNAIQAFKEQDRGLVVIRCFADSNEVVLEVEDNGVGITVDIAQKLFQPNFTTKGSGMGLGLAMVKSIIEQSKGKIEFETALNRGTKFIVHWPRA